MDQLLSVLDSGELRRDGTAVLVSRVVALLADALPSSDCVVDLVEKNGIEGGKKSASGESGNGAEAHDGADRGDSADSADSGDSGDSADNGHDEQRQGTGLGPGGVEAAGLVARLTSTDAGRRALLTHAPGIVGRVVTPWGCHCISYMDHTGCHQFNMF
jgi:hypothetical protein